jgi:hypothetical protein
MRGAVPVSYPSRGDMDCNTKERKKPIKTEAEACIPNVSVNISTVKPRIKESNSTSQPGVSKGSNKMKSI